LKNTDEKLNVIKNLRDGMAEWTKALVVTRTVAGSNLGHGRHFSPGRHLSGERPPSPARAKPTGVQLKFCRNPKNTRFYQNLQLPPPQFKQPPNGLSCRGLINNNKKKIVLIQKLSLVL